MKDKKIITKQVKGVNIGWFLANFIVMERNEEMSWTFWKAL